jgi:hypothetical protein
LGKTYRELFSQGVSGAGASRQPVSRKLEERNMSIVGNVAIDLAQTRKEGPIGILDCKQK